MWNACISLNSIAIYNKFLLKNRLDRLGISAFKLTFPQTKSNIFSLHVCLVYPQILIRMKMKIYLMLSSGFQSLGVKSRIRYNPGLTTITTCNPGLRYWQGLLLSGKLVLKNRSQSNRIIREISTCWIPSKRLLLPFNDSFFTQP